jgi:hypothetical protein
MEDNIVNDTREVAMIAEANVPDVTLPTYDQLYADFQQSKMLHANTLVREKLLQEALAEAKALSFEDKLQAMIEKIVANAMDDLKQELLSDVEDQTRDYLSESLGDEVEDIVRNMSFSVSVDR